MSDDKWLETMLRRWQQLRDEGGEVTLEEMCADNQVVMEHPELRDELREAIFRLKEQEALFAQLPREPSGATTILQQNPVPPKSQVADTDPMPSTRGLGGGTPPETEERPELPARIGRYQVEAMLGKGGFGRVYLAHDEKLHRRVAIKVPHPHLVSRPEDVEAYLKEARTAAELDHANIAPVYDVGSTQQFPFFVVSKYIAGSNLSEKTKNSRPSHRESAQIVGTVAKALHYVHRHGMVHRDIKPANILIDAESNPFVVDFGVTLKEEDYGTGPGFVGTIAYMSPEQARGEGHLVDGRSDIFSLGIVFYELLTGRYPFRRSNAEELLEQITRVDVRPPRQRDDTVSKELERICLKALAKRATDRYSTALDMAEDLRHFLDEIHNQGQARERTSPSSSAHSSPVTSDTPSVGVARVIPKGLRSFESDDAEFFLELVPGPRDRNGLPDVIRFWKMRIEQTNPATTFRVGLIYGPSGCGKSSLVKAGLLPHLDQRISPIYVQATAEDTQLQIVHGLRRECPNLPQDLDLTGTLAALRRGDGSSSVDKVVIIMDQFEQWLHAKREEDFSELVRALRQCDGATLQCILMVRDDFWMAVTRFMRQLEIPLVEGGNSAAVDLFDMEHARRVLAAFGCAYRRIPESPTERTASQRSFIEQAVSALAEDGRIICVRLALFVEMMKGRPWEPSSLREVGGVEGVGVTFLEDSFGSKSAPPQHRVHQRAARDLLESLLPESGADIKGHMRPEKELLSASGYAGRPRDFRELIDILDSELRLITPSDPEGSDQMNTTTGKPNTTGRFYQLTHDYLVPSLREWLTRKKKETWRGRAELRLAERTSQWSRSRQSRFLPSFPEYISIVLGVPATKRTRSEQNLMRAATRRHGLIWGTASALLVLACVGIWLLLAATNRRQATTLVEAVLTAPPDAVPFAIDKLQALRAQALPILRDKLERSSEPAQRLHAAFALAEFGEVPRDFLLEQIAHASAGECANMVRALRHQTTHAIGKLTEQSRQLSARLNAEPSSQEERQLDEKERRRIATHLCRLAMVLLHLGDQSVAEEIVQWRHDPMLRTTFLHEVFPVWHGEPTELAQILSETKSSALRSAICLGMGLASAQRMSQTRRQDLTPVLLELFSRCEDAATHSSAAWTLKQWTGEWPQQTGARLSDGSSDWRVNSLGMTLLKIRSGTFFMGSLAGWLDETPIHQVTISQDFWLADREVTLDQFQQFATDNQYFKDYSDEEPKDWKALDSSDARNTPVTEVSWYHAISFCNWLSRKEGLRPCYRKTGGGDWVLTSDGTGYRLPTEAEWEFSCRANARTEYCFGDEPELLRQYAVYDRNQSFPPGSRLPNAWGLFDMHGNMLEWCYDGKRNYGTLSETDPLDPRGTGRVLRGGGWFDSAGGCRAGHRWSTGPSDRFDGLGFRVAVVR